MLRIFALVLFSLVLSGCSLFGSFGRLGGGGIDFDTNASGTAEQIYAQAERLRRARRYEQAATRYGEVERQFPRNPLAVQAQFERAVTLYEGQKYAESIEAFDRFLRFNPGHQLEARATYGRALCFYDEIPDVFRDQGVTKQAQTALQDVVDRFPSTQEAADARGKLVLVRDQLAGHEMVIGRNYQQQNLHLSAQNRFKTVVDTYPTTTQVPEAFYRLVETSLALGLTGEARRYGATLGFNYPSSPWYRRAYRLLTGAEAGR